MSEQTGEKYALVLPCLLHGSIQKTYCDTACAYVILRFQHCIRSWLLTQSSLWPKGRAALSSSQAKKESLQQSSQELNDAKTTNVDKDCIWRYFQYSHGLALTVKETAARKTRMCKGPEIQLAHHVRQKRQRPYVELTTQQMTELNNVNSPKNGQAFGLRPCVCLSSVAQHRRQSANPACFMRFHNFIKYGTWLHWTPVSARSNSEMTAPPGYPIPLQPGCHIPIAIVVKWFLLSELTFCGALRGPKLHPSLRSFETCLNVTVCSYIFLQSKSKVLKCMQVCKMRDTEKNIENQQLFTVPIAICIYGYDFLSKSLSPCCLLARIWSLGSLQCQRHRHHWPSRQSWQSLHSAQKNPSKSAKARFVSKSLDQDVNYRAVITDLYQVVVGFDMLCWPICRIQPHPNTPIIINAWSQWNEKTELMCKWHNRWHAFQLFGLGEGQQAHQPVLH